MRRVWASVISTFVLFAALVWAAPPAASQSGGCAWTVVVSPNPGNKESVLSGIDGSGDDVWSVGSFKNRGKPHRTFIAHNTSEGWKRVRSPNVNDRTNALADVTYIAANDAWAVGAVRKARGRTRNLIEHWDGEKWSIVAAPSSGRPRDGLSGVDASPPGALPIDLVTADVWAVGASVAEEGKRSRPLVAHFNGTDWSLVPTPPPGGPAQLGAVHAFAPNDVWAVGFYQEGELARTLAMHWDGIAWTIVATPNPSPEGNVLTGVAGSAPDDLWAVGARSEGAPLVLHYDGSEWTPVPASLPLGESGFLFGVAASETGVWGVGFSVSALGAESLVMTGDATGWTPTHSPSPGALPLLVGVVVPVDGVPWASGARFASDARTARSLLMKCTP